MSDMRLFEKNILLRLGHNHRVRVFTIKNGR